MKLVKESNREQEIEKVSDKEAEDAFRKILAWMGEDPSRAVSYTHLTLPTILLV